MKKHVKKLVSVMLAVVMVITVFSIMPLTVSAANYKTDIINAVLISQNTWLKVTSNGVGVRTGICFTDLNFDGKPEFIYQYPGGSMLNCDADAYYLSGTSLKAATVNKKNISGSGSFTNFIDAYFDNSTGKYRMIGYQIIRNGIAHSWRGEFELSFDGKKITTKFFASKQMDDNNYSGNYKTTYYNGSNSKISESDYNKIIKNYMKNLVNANMKRDFVEVENWKSYSTSQKRAILERAYDSWSYKKYPTSVKLNRGTLGLGVGENYGLVKTVSPSSANQSVTWTSSNTSVATVSSTGNVIGKKAGTATVTVKTSNGKTAKCTVTVKAAPTSVKTNPTSLKLGVGETFTISESTNSGSYANAANLRWSSSNTSVATIAKTAGTNKAVITAKKAGTTSITIKTYNGKTYTCTLTVYAAPSSVKLSASSITLSKGKTYTISESTNSGSYANASNLKWSSSNTKVATVTKGSGNKATIKAVAKGTAYVKITLYNGKTAQCKVTVK